MYKVMLVDDDYPVLEFLSESVNWEELGLSAPSLHMDGADALAHAVADLPDILVTDIGMPKMDGLQLIGKIKEMKPNVRVAILSCHSQFEYARQAMKLNVQDYLLKESLDPAEFRKLLRQFKDSLDRETQANRQQESMRHILNRSRDKIKEIFIRSTIHQPILHPEQWQAELETFGIQARMASWLPALMHVDQFQQARQRFCTEDVLRFALNNVLEELAAARAGVVHFPYSPKRSVFLFAFGDTLKFNPYEVAASALRQFREGVRQSLKLSVSFIIGDLCRTPAELQKELGDMMSCGGQRFYLEDGAVVKKQRPACADVHLFLYYDKAKEEFMQALLDRREDAVNETVGRWFRFFRHHPQPPETVKEWMLKLMLDLKLKVHSMQGFQSPPSEEALHNEIFEIDSLPELERWVTNHLRSFRPVVSHILQSSSRPEVLKAIRYVSANMNKRIGLEEVAAHLHMNPSYFSRMFKKETGETFTDFVIRMKMDRARELLDTTNYSVGVICDMLGYDNQSYFIKTFKSVVGVTPMEYRRAGAAAK